MSQAEPFPNDPMVPPELRNNVFISTIDKFYNCLNPGGYLFVGHAESLFGLTQKFRMVHENNGTAYQRLEVAG